jgi:4-amino-4-deoxy-L-arabinose transferase-like glycosyltransferase
VKSALTWICIAAIAGGFLLGLPNLGLAPFWVDETVAVTPALSIHEHGLPTTRFGLDFMPWQLAYGLWDPATPLYRYAVAAYTAVFGFSEFSTRSFSLLMGVGCAVALLLLVRRLYDLRTGLVAAALLMTSPTFLVFAREARHFTFVAFLSLCTLGCLYASTRERSDTARVLWFVFAIALLLSQTLGYLFVPVIALYVLANDPRRFVSPRHWPVYAGVALVYLAVLAVFWNTLPFFHVTDCSNRESGCQPDPLYYANVLRVFLAPMVERNLYSLRQAWSLHHLLFLVGAIAVGHEIVTRWKDRPRSSLLVLWLLLPPLLLASREVKFPRYLLIWSAPVCALLVAVAIDRIAARARGYRAPVEILLVLLALASPRVLNVATWEAPSWRLRSGAQDYISENVRYPDADNVHRIGWQLASVRAYVSPGDTITTSLDDATLQYYLERPVHGFLDSSKTDADFLALLAQAEETGATVWFFDSLPTWNHCLTDQAEPRSIDCRVKFPRFYAACFDPPSPDAPTCRRLSLF